MRLYHGTIYDFKVPDPARGREATDFGAGFYTTDSERMAADWRKGEPGKHINVYELTLGEIESCNLRILRYKEADVRWAKFVYNNRKRKPNKAKFDIIIGPLADNSLNKWFDKIDNGQITWEELAAKINYQHYNSLQYCFKSSESIKLLEYANRR